MHRLLHIIATPHEEESRTLQISEAFLDGFRDTHSDWVIDELNLSKEELPSLAMKQVNGKYILLGGHELFGRYKEAWIEILQHIERFKTADLFLISTPMWNFHIPYMLKHYIDLIVQPKYLFQYREDGSVEGLVKDKKMVIITTRGGSYEGNYQVFDHQEPYLRTVFGFIGITEMSFIKAEPMDRGAEIQKEKIFEARKIAEEMGRNA